MSHTRGTTNGAQRGNTKTRRLRREWIMKTYAADVPGFCRCYRCGVLLFSPDDPIKLGVALGGSTGKVLLLTNPVNPFETVKALRLTIDRIIPGCAGGTYARNNIRPACGPCNSETGGALRGTGQVAA